jgi:hypothetical protein
VGRALERHLRSSRSSSRARLSASNPALQPTPRLPPLCPPQELPREAAHAQQAQPRRRPLSAHGAAGRPCARRMEQCKLELGRPAPRLPRWCQPAAASGAQWRLQHAAGSRAAELAVAAGATGVPPSGRWGGEAAGQVRDSTMHHDLNAGEPGEPHASQLRPGTCPAC